MKLARITFKVLLIVMWAGVVVTFLVYNFYVDIANLNKPPCDLSQKIIRWRSTVFCASPRQALVWTLNYALLFVFLYGGLAISALAGLLQRLSAGKRPPNELR